MGKRGWESRRGVFLRDEEIWGNGLGVLLKR